jgi:hypothetical protein
MSPLCLSDTDGDGDRDTVTFPFLFFCLACVLKMAYWADFHCAGGLQSPCALACDRRYQRVRRPFSSVSRTREHTEQDKTTEQNRTQDEARLRNARRNNTRQHNTSTQHTRQDKTRHDTTPREGFQWNVTSVEEQTYVVLKEGIERERDGTPWETSQSVSLEKDRIVGGIGDFDVLRPYGGAFGFPLSVLKMFSLILLTLTGVIFPALASAVSLHRLYKRVVYHPFVAPLPFFPACRGKGVENVVRTFRVPSALFQPSLSDVVSTRTTHALEFFTVF